MRAVKTLQTYLNQNGSILEVDGIFGKKTRDAIEKISVPNWVKTALKEVGVKEVAGKGNSARVLEYHDTASGNYSSDEVAWCGSFINWVMLHHEEKTVKYPERAKSWLSFGKSSIVPVVGSIAIKSREGGGHVCMVIGKDKDGSLYCIGGNQNNEVNISKYPKEVFLDFRVPTTHNKEELPYYTLGSSNKTVGEA
jgi:uncharacterized protein (TIGR02594 family)